MAADFLAKMLLPPQGGRMLVPFSGSGSEMIGALKAGWNVTGIELNEDYCQIAERRIQDAMYGESDQFLFRLGGQDEIAEEVLKA
jgi:hypothetical protein